MTTAPDGDTESLASIVRAFYDCISFEPGGRPDWDREGKLFGPHARMTRMTETEMRWFTVDEYRENFERMMADGTLPSLFEHEIASQVLQFGEMAHVFSTYEAKRTAGDPEVLFRGINSIQAFRRDGRWWLHSVIWFREGPRTPLPPQFLP
jgi:hypothetical protein